MLQWWAEPGWSVGLFVASGLAVISLAGSYAVLVLPVAVALAWFAGRGLRSLTLGVVIMVGAAGVALIIEAVRDPAGFGSGVISIPLIMLVAVVLPWWLGRSRRQRLEQRVREQRLIGRQARHNERTRIARDMHDSLGHELALIALHSGALELASDGTPEQRAAAAAVRAGATAATERLHAIVSLLGDGPGDVDPGSPAELGSLVQRARDAGVEIELVGPVDGSWSPDTTRAAGRVVQEAITNAVKHAPGSRIVVRIEDAAEADLVRIEVINSAGRSVDLRDGRGVGQGLIGLDERLRLIGGRLIADRYQEGFRVVATIPRSGRTNGGAEDAPEASPVLTESRRRHRRRRMITALLPAGLAIVLAATLFAVHAVTVAQTALSPQRYGELELGRPRAELAAALPARSQPGPPPILAVPPAPDGTRCEFYQARWSVIDFSAAMFRLCFADRGGVVDSLVAKDHLLPAFTR